jgi:hypothetical protein
VGAGQSLNVENSSRVQVTLRDLGDGPEMLVEAFNERWDYGRREARADGTVIALRPFAPD